jgi:hypothetical protein
VVQTLSTRLESDITEMMISKGEGKKARERRRLRGPLEKARREVLREQLLQEEFAEEQRVIVETKRAQQQARALRSVRLSRLPDAGVIFDDELDSKRDEEGYHVVHSYPSPDGAQSYREQERRHGEPKEQRERLFRERQTASDQERLRMRQFELETKRQRPKEEQRQQGDDEIKWKRGGSRRGGVQGRREKDEMRPKDVLRPLRDEKEMKQREQELERARQRPPSEARAQRRREEGGKVQSDKHERKSQHQVYRESHRRRRRSGGISFS